jgi:ParB/RepB/Spo0J family partition protein
MSQINMEAVNVLQPNPLNPRKAVDAEELELLGNDMLARGCLVPLLVRPSGLIIDGFRRWLAAQRKGIKLLPVIKTECPEAEIPGIMLATCFHRSDLSDFEKASAVCEIARSHAEWPQTQLAEYLHISPVAVCRYLAMTKVTDEWRAAFKSGTVGPSEVVTASKLPVEDQAGLLAMKLAGATRDDLERAGRKARTTSSSEPAPKAKKLHCYLTGGICVTVSGEQISLDEGVEALGKAVAAMKKAIQEGYTAKTFAAAMKDKASKN